MTIAVHTTPALSLGTLVPRQKTFHENVKKCRDVIVKKVLEQGWDTHTTHYTHVGPMTPYIVVIIIPYVV